MIKKGEWVSIKKTLLEPEERTGRLPEETKATPFTLWVKGRLTEDAELGGEASVITRTGRLESGLLEEANPMYQLDYGFFLDELLRIGDQARNILYGGDERG
ncbi:MAG: 2-amino-4-ketopentanoate thiolase [Clostridiales bacterium]|nr:2-amino-4-ketopentanoate thiolase [Clostridiales bacterium]